MRIKEVVARNLRTLCDGEPSLASVARQLHISPQQFNRYLQAEHLPSERLIIRICRHFGISETDLFNPAFSAHSPSAWQAAETVLARAIEMTRQVDLAEGRFDLYLSAADDPEMVMRTLVVTRLQDGLMEFGRVTRYKPTSAQDWTAFRGRHQGFVVQAQRSIYLCGVNRLSVYEPSMVVVERAATSTLLYAGYGVLTGLFRPEFMFAVMVPSPQKPMKSLFARLGALGIDAPTIPPIVRNALRGAKERMKDWPELAPKELVSPRHSYRPPTERPT